MSKSRECTACHGKGRRLVEKQVEVKDRMDQLLRGTAFGMGYSAVRRTETVKVEEMCDNCGGSGEVT